MIAQKIYLSFLITVIVISNNAMADSCYRLFKSSPNSSPFHNQESTWCLKEFSQDSKLFQFVYSPDHPNTQELSYLLEIENQKAKNVTFTSINQGHKSIQKTSLQHINPLPFRWDQFHLKNISLLEKGRPLWQPQQREILNSYLSYSHWENFDTNLYKIREGQYQSQIEKEHQPYRGYWWPYQHKELFKGPTAPLAIYDDLIQTHLGKTSESATWESINHSLDHVDWGGHCNGWVASSILHKEPDSHLWDPKNNRVIPPFLQKAWLTENSFCVEYAFYGKRFRNPGDDANDIHPHRFHKVLLYYIKHLGKAVAFDYYSSAVVDNHIYSGFEFDIEKMDSQRFLVHATLQAHGYDSFDKFGQGLAPSYSRKYVYELETDEKGIPIGGRWLSKNPDFLWVPLAQKQCGRENPFIKKNELQELLEGLPLAKRVNEPGTISIDKVVAQKEKVSIPVPKNYGASLHLQVETENSLSNGDYIVYEFISSRNSQISKDYIDYHEINSGNLDFQNHIQLLSMDLILNPNETNSNQNKIFKINSQQYWDSP